MLRDAHARGAIAFGDFMLDAATGELRSSKSVIRLQPQPLKVLLVLLETAGDLVSRDRLRQELAGDALYGDADHAINVAITKLRSALHDSAEEPRYIETFARRGYRFLVPVETSEPEPQEDQQLPLPGIDAAEAAKVSHPHAIHTSEGPRIRPRLPPRSVELRYRVAAWCAGGVLLVAVITAIAKQTWLKPPPHITTSEARLSLVLPLGHAIDDVGGIAISPDGQVIVYAARPGGEAARLFVRRIDAWHERELPGTIDSGKPFFSPDGKWIAYASHRGLYKIPTEGGPAQIICGPLKCGESFNGGSWGENGRIVFASGWGKGAELLRVEANGGPPEKFSNLRGADGQFFFSPELLPGGRNALVVACSLGQCSIVGTSLQSAEQRVVVASGSQPHYSRTGHLMYVAEERLVAVPFDAERMTVTGAVRILAESVSDPFDTATYAASQAGVVAVLRDSGFRHPLAWQDRSGNVRLSPLIPRAYLLPALSPDGNRFAVTIRQGASRNVWIGSPDREPLTQLTFGNDDAYSLWSVDGRSIVFTSGRDGHYNLYSSAADGSDMEKRITNTEESQRATSWHPHGLSLLLNQWAEPDGFDIYELPSGIAKPRPFLKTAFNELEAVFSPDGRWVAYQSDESGRYEVYIRAYPAGGSKLRVSIAGGLSPRWSRNGSELFYVSQIGLMTVSVLSNRSTLSLGRPERLSAEVTSRNYDVSRDGSRILFVREDESGGSQSRIDVIVGVDEELRKIEKDKGKR